MAMELATPQTYAIMNLEPGELSEALAVNTGGEQLSPFDLDRVKVPAGGATTWEVPTLDGPQEVKSLDGILIYQRTVRSYWAEDFSGAGSPPDCSSQDGQIGVGNPGGDCSVCPLAQFGTGKNGRSQACKMNRMLFMLREDSVLPVLVAAPPSSLKPIKTYLLQLASKGRPFYSVVSRLELRKTKNADGIQYAEIIPSRVRDLNADEMARIKAAYATLGPLLSAVRVDADE